MLNFLLCDAAIEYLDENSTSDAATFESGCIDFI